MNRGYTYCDVVPGRFDGAAVLEFYVSSYPRTSRAEWVERLSKGLIRVNGETASAETIVRAGDCLAYHRPPWDEPPVPTELPVVFEDEDVLVIDKPVGLPVLPGGGYLENTALHLLRKRSGMPDSPNPIHRLGRGTSGLQIFGKNREALSALGKALKRREIGRRYLAVLSGVVDRDTFSVETPIGLVAHPRLGPVHAAADDGRPSRTDFRILDRCEDPETSLAEIVLHSGRTHQIRIHTAVAGHPLEGDPFYVAGGRWDPAAATRTGNIPVPADGGYRLHAWRVTFDHPRDGARLDLVRHPPEGFWHRPPRSLPLESGASQFCHGDREST